VRTLASRRRARERRDEYDDRDTGVREQRINKDLAGLFRVVSLLLFRQGRDGIGAIRRGRKQGTPFDVVFFTLSLLVLLRSRRRSGGFQSVLTLDRAGDDPVAVRLRQDLPRSHPTGLSRASPCRGGLVPSLPGSASSAKNVSRMEPFREVAQLAFH
jgi:hypothetical protein